MTLHQIAQIQIEVGAIPDGFWGPKSIAACKAFLLSLMPSPNPWPDSDEGGLKEFYGSPGDESKLVSLTPGVTLKYEGRPVTSIRCHNKVAKSLSRVLHSLESDFPFILDHYDGCYNNRNMRNGFRPSLHARGAAIDFWAEENGNSSHWPSASSMPFSVIKAFTREGWLSAGAFWGRDAMHFQATR